MKYVYVLLDHIFHDNDKQEPHIACSSLIKKYYVSIYTFLNAM